jgi:hypothetical protein
MTKKAQTDFLFAQPSFFSGVARTGDMWGAFDDYNTADSSAEADFVATASDWLMVGGDLSSAIDHFKTELAGV